MDVITLSVEIPKDRHLVLDLPSDVPIGKADITIHPHEQASPSAQVVNSAHEAARAKLLAAGILSTAHVAPKDAVRLSDEALQRLGTLPAGSPSLDDLINEDRGTY